ncbi:hypothetical protein K1T71_001828 [Dendrolimus kikuchii]|uniref:Uncharacterized protein n=1 Tax=Dendrolimus kikuchii TaxID=765133 RepID=A0ACC1DET9_9NEOP|nr:hypothetical protein K1T71_001828 [Dendrolimus kikuchii]
MFALLVVSVLLLLLTHILYNYERNRLVKKIPGPPVLFIIGNALDIFGTPVISTSKHNEKSFIYRFMRNWLREGLLVSKGSKWQQRRKILTPAFHFNILRQFCDIEEHKGESIDVIPLVTEYTLHSICETAMGTRLNHEGTDEGKTYTNSVNELGRCYVQRISRLYLYVDFIYNLSSIGILAKKYLNIIHRFTNSKKTAMLDLLIAAEKDGTIDIQGIQEEVETFMFEVGLLKNYDLYNCYLENNVQLCGYKVPAGTYCHIFIYDLHRREDLFKDPLLFDPNRFLPENTIGRHPYAYIPFSAGPRNCIGQKFAMLEMKSVLSAILRNYELNPITQPSDLEFATDLVLKTTHPIYVQFVKRNT